MIMFQWVTMNASEEATRYLKVRRRLALSILSGRVSTCRSHSAGTFRHHRPQALLVAGARRQRPRAGGPVARPRGGKDLPHLPPHPQGEDELRRLHLTPQYEHFFSKRLASADDAH